MKDGAKVYADFQKVDDEGRLILTCAGTARDLARHRIELREGLVLAFYSDDADDEGAPDDLLAEGTVQYDAAAGRWVALLDRGAIRHASDRR